jgi:membrane protein DedA with SNARE-associated domain
MMMGGFLFLGGEELVLASFIKLIVQVVIPVSLGIAIGSAVVFFIFYFAGEPAINRFGKYFGVSFSDIIKLKEKMSNSISDEIFIFLARATPFFPITLVNVFCGLVRYPPVKFFAISFLGTLVRATILGFLGWQIGAFHREFASHLQTIEDFLTVVVLLVLFFLIYRQVKRRKGPTPTN